MAMLPTRIGYRRRPFAKWRIGLSMAMMLTAAALIFANSRIRNADLIGHWTCLNPDKYVSEVTFDADGTGVSRGQLGSSVFRWERTANKLVVTPVSVDPSTYKSQTLAPHYIRFEISADKQHLTTIYESAPSDMKSDPPLRYVKDNSPR